MNPFVRFMSSTAGRGARIVAGLAIVAAGLLMLEGTTAIIVAVIGVIPILAGVFDFCLFAPLFGAPLAGKKVREEHQV